ncbi:MAG: flagellar biosynthetic protein FliO [Lachnospiraceae bacterium]
MLVSSFSGINAVGEFLTLLLIFIFVLAITYGTTRWIANYQKEKVHSNNIQIIETYRITANKYIQIVQTGSKYLVIAVCKDTVTLLTELTEEQIKFPESVDHSNLTFKEILEKAKNLTSKK